MRCIPCMQALLAGDMNAVFLMDEPELIPRHNTYEFIWFLKTGYARHVSLDAFD